MTSSIIDNDILLGKILQYKFGMVSGITISDSKIIECPGGIPSQAEQDKWTAEYEAQIPTLEWKEKMVISDGPLPRWAEDLIDLTDGAISSQTQKLSEDKKLLRAMRP